ncbi:hypothetical protein H0G86_004294 [Trichoderma simmonsii]|uniref:Uncharacterized protein n=1 Tax=Trichoderma simmonsii TaxID=1491479 RepID=A0A8G0LA90_9HYPO|nr:hypothetical protein H0G86_004294 [Trichoderma simmonsii]
MPVVPYVYFVRIARQGTSTLPQTANPRIDPIFERSRTTRRTRESGIRNDDTRPRVPPAKTLPQLSQAENQKLEADDKGRPESMRYRGPAGVDAEEDPECQGDGGAKTAQRGQG